MCREISCSVLKRFLAFIARIWSLTGNNFRNPIKPNTIQLLKTPKDSTNATIFRGRTALVVYWLRASICVPKNDGIRRGNLGKAILFRNFHIVS